MPSTIDLFKQFPNRVFIETGTYHGSGVENALAAGFEKVFSVELSGTLFEENASRFKLNQNVILFAGASYDCLPHILFDLHCSATFWLDAHHSGGETARGKEKCPVLRELAEIAKHHISTHTILIDDVRIFGTDEFDNITIGQVAEALWKINPDYTLRRHDGHVKNDVLSASLL